MNLATLEPAIPAKSSFELIAKPLRESPTPSTSARAANFNLIARPYRWLEYLTLGSTLQRCRTHFIPALLDQKRALVLGDGDGRFLNRLLIANTQLRADAVDTSAVMLQLLRNRCGRPASLRTHHMSALSCAPASSCDLIVTNFFLDCLTQNEVDQLITNLSKRVRRNTLWLISDFRIPTGLMHLPARILIRCLYLTFRILTGLRTTRLPDYATPLIAAGFAPIAEHQTLAGILTTQLWRFNPLPCHQSVTSTDVKSGQTL